MKSNQSAFIYRVDSTFPPFWAAGWLERDPSGIQWGAFALTCTSER